MEDIVRRFESYLRERGYSEATIDRYLWAFRKLIKVFGYVPTIEEIDEEFKSRSASMRGRYRVVVRLYMEMEERR